MAAKIVHFGVETDNRIATLKSAGYRVEECRSLAQLHAALVGILPADAILITDNDGAAPDQARSLARATSIAPLILCHNGKHHYNPAEFDLIIPPLMEAQDWLSEIAKLMARFLQHGRSSMCGQTESAEPSSNPAPE
jgi:hypothetical protein